ncbi:2438_t:CDS:2 [Entrophospora sp. SA101]|nr:2438_t:CDS:2 [Entrophospora sp. SA101]CAJ0848256.1 6126_t:CDS:2 [Entrophospora sp. SA101]CAJ0870164.1 9973_t:CDS:2 [Entrophospora sp. SA101]
MKELSVIPISDEPLINTSSEDANMEDISNQFHKLYFDIDVVKEKLLKDLNLTRNEVKYIVENFSSHE